MKKLQLLLVFIILFIAQNIQALYQDPVQVTQALQKLIPYITERTVAIHIKVNEKSGYGSGAFISSDGHILTCAHVTEISDDITVITSDGKTYPGKKLGMNEANDYSILKIDIENAPYFPLGNVQQHQLLDWVIASGHPGGPYEDQKPAIVLGRIRGLHKKLLIEGFYKCYHDAIQTDTPIFAGNSGGPLIDLQGNLIGINGAILLVNDISFSISIDAIKKHLATLKKGKDVKGYLPSVLEILEILLELQEEMGMEEFDKMYKPLKNFFDMLDNRVPVKQKLGMKVVQRQNKVIVKTIHKKGICYLAGFRPGDQILSIDDQPLYNVHQFIRYIQDKTKTYLVKIQRNNNIHNVLLAYSSAEYSRIKTLQRYFKKHVIAMQPSVIPLYQEVQYNNKTKEENIGYGVFIDQKGYILTCSHIIKPETTIYTIYQGKTYIVQQVGKNDILDIALCKIITEKNKIFPVIEWGDDKKIQQGEWVISISNNTLQVGGVTMNPRSILQQRRTSSLGLFGIFGSPNKSLIRCYDSVIHHDSMIDENQFGTPLLNQKGQMIGINVGNFCRGTTLAIPITEIQKILPNLVSGICTDAPDKYKPLPNHETMPFRLIDYFFNPDTKYNFNDILPRHKKAE
ncbi:MAG TPA: trypsin-like peptidase domain-containing protein [Planctomycetota bacterium]|nr:trypsin-like peptidase domain-containing protein [Planctomycetota bacterium]